MKSKEALEKLYDGFKNGMAGRSYFDIIKQDLERLEKLEKVIEILKRKDVTIYFLTIEEHNFLKEFL